MNRRRIAALAAFGLIGLGVVALIASDRDDEPAPAAASSPTAAPADASATPAGNTPETEVEAQAAGDATEGEVEAVPLRYDPALVPDLPDRGPHPPLVGLDGWQQSDIETLDELRGKVVAVQFWTFGCSNCKATKPHMAVLYEKYGGEDFEIVGVHSPEFDFEKDPERIAGAAVDLNVTWPIALDTEKRSFRSWQEGGRRFWPRIYLIDRDGNIRYDKIGEGRYDEIDAAVGALIDEPWDRDLAAELDEWVERDADENSHPM